MPTTKAEPEPDVAEGYSAVRRRRYSKPSTLIIPTLLTALSVAWTSQPWAASQTPIQLAQGASDLFELGKDMLGMGEQTPEGEASTGIANGVPFLVRFRDTIGSLEPGAPVHVRGMQMGTVREVRITFDPATASFSKRVVHRGSRMILLDLPEGLVQPSSGLAATVRKVADFHYRRVSYGGGLYF